jgi:hypothetical protein
MKRTLHSDHTANDYTSLHTTFGIRSDISLTSINGIVYVMGTRRIWIDSIITGSVNSGNALSGLHTEGAEFETRPGHQRFLEGFLSPSRQMTGQYQVQATTTPFPISSISSLIHYLTIPRYTVQLPTRVLCLIKHHTITTHGTAPPLLTCDWSPSSLGCLNSGERAPRTT